MRGRIVRRKIKGEKIKGSYTIVLELGRDDKTGRYRQKWIAVKGKHQAAVDRFTELMQQYKTTGVIETTKLTTGEFLRQWIESRRGKLDVSSWERYEQIIRTHFIPDFGSIPLAKLTLSDLERHYAKIQAAGLSIGTVRYHRAVIHKALQSAVQRELLFRNVADIDSEDQLKKEHIEVQFWDSEPMNRFLQAMIGSPFYPLFYTALFTGMRRSELLGLKWSDIDLKTRQIAVRRTLKRDKKGVIYITDNKTRGSKRTIKLTPTNADVLTQLWETSKNRGKDDSVFAIDGQPPRPQSITRAWQTGCKKAGVTMITFHDARHTHATLLLKAGVHPKVVQERLGHSSISMTLDTYSHVVPGMQEAAATKFDENLNSILDS
jgi:integrase